MERKETDNGGYGLFIVLEGVDGGGKSTQAKLLVERLNNSGHKAIYLREPTSGEWGQKIRRIAVDGREGITLEDELEYFINDRAEDLEKNILPALERGEVVVMDRYYFSNMAYQGALGLDVQDIFDRNKKFKTPDIVIFLDIKPSDGLNRIGEREGGANIGYEKLDYLEKVYEVFGGPLFNSMKRLDATGSVEEVSALIWAEVSPLFG